MTTRFYAEIRSEEEQNSKYVVRGNFIDAPSPKEIRVREDTEIVVNRRSGRIERIAEGKGNWARPDDYEEDIAFRVIEVPERCAVVPGFVDCHVHAPQYRQVGTKTDIPLMEWLKRYTFPTESAFSSPDHASRTYKALVRRLLLNGTTTALYFGSNHLEATQILAKTCASYKQRALIGKTCSDQLLPDYYIESTDNSVADTESFIRWCTEKWPEGDDALIKPVITPRFVPTCSSRLLERLGELARKYPNVHIQTHAAESYDQVGLVESQWPALKRDITILQSVGLLRKKTVLAHCTHLTNEEASVMARIGAGIASCPYSNMLFAGKLLPVDRFRSLGVEVGLGTDIAGGHDSWIGSAVRQAILADRVQGWDRHEEGKGTKVKEESIDWKYAFHLATRGGAKTLALGNVGVFEVGMKWDAVELDLSWPDEEDDSERPVVEQFERWVCSHGGPRAVRTVWVDGQWVLSRERA